jgi:hypothetical protein
MPRGTGFSFAMETALADAPVVTEKKARRRCTGHRRTEQSDPSVTREEVLAALTEIVNSADFPATARNRRFLEHVVRCSVDSRFEKIGGYQVATEVFGRPATFNPATDPIVRIEAAKLRRDLETYYLKSGSRAAVRITLPRGGYVPVFDRQAPRQENAFLDPHAITVHVLHDGDPGSCGPAFRTRVVDCLVRRGGVAVFAGPALSSADGLLDSDTARDLGRRNGARFILSGEAHADCGGQVVFTARLHDGQKGRLLWSEDIAGRADTLPDALVERALSAQRELVAKLDGVPDLSV